MGGKDVRFYAYKISHGAYFAFLVCLYYHETESKDEIVRQLLLLYRSIFT